MTAARYFALSEAEAAKWALIFPLDGIPGDINGVEAEYVADQLEALWFADMSTNRPHVIPRGCDPNAIAGFRAMCRKALAARILALRVPS